MYTHIILCCTELYYSMLYYTIKGKRVLMSGREVNRAGIMCIYIYIYIT